MSDNAPEVKIDPKGIIQQITDKVIEDFMISLLPDEKSKKFTSGIMAIHRKYGIDSATSIRIVMGLGELIKEMEE